MKIRKILSVLKFIFPTIIISLVSLELVLRVNPMILGNRFKNHALTKYHTQYSGIYYSDQKMNMYFMKPNFNIKNYFNGYTWTHQTDKFGFRNPSNLEQADIILLGDFFAYGHGLEKNQTIRYFLDQLTNYSVFNMARQGDSPISKCMYSIKSALT